MTLHTLTSFRPLLAGVVVEGVPGRYVGNNVEKGAPDRG